MFEKPILIKWHPNSVDHIGKYEKSLVNHYKYDHYTEYIAGKSTISPKEKKCLGMSVNLTT